MTEEARVPTTERLVELIRQMQGQPVILWADLVVDRFISGTPKRISREAPVLILRYEGEHSTPGGGANAVANVLSLGGSPLTLGVVGDDKSGRGLLDQFSSLGVDTSGIAVRSGYRTPTKTRVLGGAEGGIKQQIVRFDIEDHLDLGADELSVFRQALETWQGSHAAIRAAILSDYGYGAVDGSLVEPLRQALAPKSQILLDSRFQLGALPGCDAATPNEEEAEALWGSSLDDAPGGFAQAGENLRQRLGLSTLLITRGSRGMGLFSGGLLGELPVHGTDQVADVTGAGDTVIATFALAVAAGATGLEAAALANYAGGIVVMKMGTATLKADELDHAVRSDSRPLESLALRSVRSIRSFRNAGNGAKET